MGKHIFYKNVFGMLALTDNLQSKFSVLQLRSSTIRPKVGCANFRTGRKY